MDEITDFLFENTPSTVFVLNGYAGTGKSTSIGHLVQYLPRMGFRSVLMAPTGRAAKVMGACQQKAFTIHKQIYFTKNEGGSGMQFTLKPNKYKIHCLL